MEGSGGAHSTPGGAGLRATDGALCVHSPRGQGTACAVWRVLTAQSRPNGGPSAARAAAHRCRVDHTYPPSPSRQPARLTHSAVASLPVQEGRRALQVGWGGGVGGEGGLLWVMARARAGGSRQRCPRRPALRRTPHRQQQRAGAARVLLLQQSRACRQRRRAPPRRTPGCQLPSRHHPRRPAFPRCPAACHAAARRPRAPALPTAATHPRASS